MPRWVSYIECYHVVIADTNETVKIIDGDAGCVGLVPGGYVAKTVFPESEVQ